MNEKTPQNSLSFEDLLTEVDSSPKTNEPFPLATHAARCSNCSHFRHGKCNLKHCCCMTDRIKAHSCSYSDVLDHCFSRIKDNVFHYRLHILSDRVSSNKTFFLDSEHRKRFKEGLALNRNGNPPNIAQIYLLSANERLWDRAKPFLTHNLLMLLKVSSVTDKTERDLLILSNRFVFGAKVMEFEDIADGESTDFDTFFLICNSVLLSVYGEDVIRIAEHYKRRKRKKKQYRRQEDG